jgi:hypothetical protein
MFADDPRCEGVDGADGSSVQLIQRPKAQFRGACIGQPPADSLPELTCRFFREGDGGDALEFDAGVDHRADALDKFMRLATACACFDEDVGFELLLDQRAVCLVGEFQDLGFHFSAFRSWAYGCSWWAF